MWEYSESRDKDNRGGEDINKVIKYLFADGNKKKYLVVAYEHVTKHVANMKNDTYTSNDPSYITEESKCHMIQVMHSFVENDIIFLIPAYYKFT